MELWQTTSKFQRQSGGFHLGEVETVSTRCGAQHSVRAALWVCVSEIWSFSTVCENLRWMRPLTAEKSFSENPVRSYFSLFVDQSSPDYVNRCGRDRSLQHHFPIVDILFHSGDIRDRSANSSEIAPKSMFFGPNFWGPEILDLVFKIAPVSDMWQSFAALTSDFDNTVQPKMVVENGYIPISGCRSLLRSPGYTLFELAVNAVIENPRFAIGWYFDAICHSYRDIRVAGFWRPWPFPGCLCCRSRLGRLSGSLLNSM